MHKIFVCQRPGSIYGRLAHLTVTARKFFIQDFVVKHPDVFPPLRVK